MPKQTKVRGDWLPDDHPGYDARVDDQRWNGWASPAFTLEVARQVAADTQKLAADNIDDPNSQLDVVTEEVVDGRIIFQVTTDYGWEKPEVTTWEPDHNGLYAIGAWGWCWYENDHYEEGG